MLTDQEMLKIAEKFIKRIVDKDIEAVILTQETINKPYGNIYYFQSKEFLLTRDFNKHLGGNAPFLVEKNTGRVVSFGTRIPIKHQLLEYENGTMPTALNTYWYPNEDRFDYK